MKFSIYFSLLILQIGIKGEPSSLSFINLIPNLIANGQFIQEKIINSYIEFNQTLPWIYLDHKFNANESNCSQDIQLLVRDLTDRKTWALKSKFYIFFFEFSKKINFSLFQH